MAAHVVARVTDVPRGGMSRVDVAGVSICLAHTEDGCFYAIQDECTHEQESLSNGWLEGTEVECALHGSIFDLRTGEPRSLPAIEAASVYPVTTDGDLVVVEL